MFCSVFSEGGLCLVLFACGVGWICVFKKDGVWFGMSLSCSFGSGFWGGVGLTWWVLWVWWFCMLPGLGRYSCGFGLCECGIAFEFA